MFFQKKKKEWCWTVHYLLIGPIIEPNSMTIWESNMETLKINHFLIGQIVEPYMVDST